tara:strand:+ start:67 stop:318 length:252 start_codon:yes stop_codon:yes gene_type:complete
VIELESTEDDNILVETPETRRPPRSRQPRQKHVPGEVQPGAAGPVENAADSAPAEEKPKRASAPRRPRAPRKPKTDDASKAAE